MSADLHAAAIDWQKLLDFARERGWRADLTDNGFVRFEKDRSVVFGPNIGAPLDVLREAAKRLVYADRYHAQHGATRP
jgi:hypothetical protein